MEHEFELQFRFEPSVDAGALVERLYEAGCADALVGTGRAGMISLMFIRDASSAIEAISSAIRNVKSAAAGARLIAVKHETVCFNDVTSYL
jgi:hypothetical protein